MGILRGKLLNHSILSLLLCGIGAMIICSGSFKPNHNGTSTTATPTRRLPGSPTPTKPVPLQVTGYSTIVFKPGQDNCPDGTKVYLGLQGIQAVGDDTLFLYGGYGTINDAYGGSVLLRSTDDGHTWESVFESVQHNSILFLSFIDENQGWLVSAWVVEAIADFKFFKTTDGGKEWTYVSTIPIKGTYNEATRMQFLSPTEGEMDFVYMYGPPGTDRISYMKTHDGGLTWAEESRREFKAQKNPEGEIVVNSYKKNLPSSLFTVDTDFNYWFLGNNAGNYSYSIDKFDEHAGKWLTTGRIADSYICTDDSLVIE